jgi:tRNA A37 threonylcarbamoyladenosine synthetase subunit TsaC/SUA5/YrdC
MTSANVHGAADSLTVEDVEVALGGIDVVLVPDGEDVLGIASTVVDARGDTPVVLREGVISQAEVTAAWPS